MSEPNGTTCSYCVRNTAEFEDLDGDPICEDCSLPERETESQPADTSFAAHCEGYC